MTVGILIVTNGLFSKNFPGEVRTRPRLGFGVQAAMGAEKRECNCTFQGTAEGPEPDLEDS